MRWNFTSGINWGLTQGIIGRRLQSLLPSATAVGPNTYLSELDFLRMLGAAFIVHIVVFVVAALFPSEQVTNIPVRALSFKLGDQNRIAAYGTPSVAPKVEAAPTPPAPVMQASSGETWRAAPKAKPKEALPAPPKPAPVRPAIRPRDPLPYTPKQKVVAITEPERTVPVENRPQPLQPIPAPPAIAPNPQQYVREVGLPSPQLLAGLPPTSASGAVNGAIGGQGTQNTTTAAAQTEQVILERYTQQISAWIWRHQIYPAGAAGRSGRVVVRVRIDRGGYVRYRAIEESSGVAVLDAAALDMIQRANPVPAVPPNYPAGNLIEFQIPINFDAPR